MIKFLLWVGRVGGIVGLLLAGVAVAARLTGQWRVGDMSVGTLLFGGVAAMVVAVLAYAAAIAERPRS
jgi:hypothetical protein